MGTTDSLLFDLDEIKLEDIEPWQVDHVGAELGARRSAQGIPVETLAADLKIRSGFVLALEAGRYSDLPGLPYAIGYVRSIADYLGLDGEAFARRLKDEQGDDYVAPALSLPEPEEIREGGSPKALLAAVSLALGTLAYGGWLLYSQPSDDAARLIAARPATAAPPTPGTLPTAVAPGPAVAADVAPTPAAAAPEGAPKAPEDAIAARPTSTGASRMATIAPAAATAPKPADSETADSIRATKPFAAPEPTEELKTVKPAPGSLADAPIILEARGLTWVHLKDAKGITIVAGAKKKGWRFTLPSTTGLRLTLGRADQLVIRVGDRTLPPLRPNSSPVHNVSLDRAKLKQQAVAIGR